MTTQRRQQDIRRVAKILRDGNYTYDQSKDLFKAARQRVGLQVSKQKKGSVDRLTKDEFEAFLNTAYARSGAQGLLIRRAARRSEARVTEQTSDCPVTERLYGVNLISGSARSS